MQIVIYFLFYNCTLMYTFNSKDELNFYHELVTIIFKLNEIQFRILKIKKKPRSLEGNL